MNEQKKTLVTWLVHHTHRVEHIHRHSGIFAAYWEHVAHGNNAPRITLRRLSLNLKYIVHCINARPFMRASIAPCGCNAHNACIIDARTPQTRTHTQTNKPTVFIMPKINSYCTIAFEHTLQSAENAILSSTINIYFICCLKNWIVAPVCVSAGASLVYSNTILRHTEKYRVEYI